MHFLLHLFLLSHIKRTTPPSYTFHKDKASPKQEKMEPPSPENYRNPVIQELIRGRDFAAELQNLLQKTPRDWPSDPVDGLIEKIMQSFTGALSVLNSGDTQLVSPNSPATHVCLSCSDDHRNNDSGESVRTPAAKNRRGGYKRRKSSATWTKVLTDPFNDGHGWRKYGQKEILGAKFSRAYFRCTHKNDQGCQAIKQVQKKEDDPSKYSVTYMGQHTCKDPSTNPQIILDSTYTEPFSLTFGSNPGRKQEHLLSPCTSIKQESHEEIIRNFTPYNSSTPSPSPSSSSSECLIQSDLNIFESCGPVTKLPVIIPDHGDGLSGSPTGSHTLDMDMMVVDSLEFDDLLCFDEGEFLEAGSSSRIW